MQSKIAAIASFTFAGAVAFGAFAAQAQEVIVDDGAVIVAEEPVIVADDPVFIDEPVVVADEEVTVVENAQEPVVIEEGEVAVAEPPVVPAARVYGWSSGRGGDCGTFHYWNGVRCADARVDPPNPD
jgi:hypothetical protein